MRKIVVLIFALFVLQSAVNVSAGPLNSFAENPIPYWDDDSLDVALSWDSTEQTVTVAHDSYAGGYYEDMSVVTDWAENINWDASDSWSSITGIMTLETFKDSANDYDYLYSDTPNLSSPTGYTVEVRWKTNTTDHVQLWLRAYAADAQGGALENYIKLPKNTDWTISTFTVAIATLESIGICTQVSDTYDGPLKTEIDYIHVYEATGDLDIGVPIILQDSQQVELYVNSTDLNSEVRLEIYDDTEALDTYCLFNNTHVIFPDSEYAQTDGLSRIEFSLDNARMIGTITVFDKDSILINQYNDTSLISGTNFLRMNDSVFNGSFTLFYLNGDLTYSAELSIIEEFFLGTGMIGYLGPLAIVLIGYFVSRKDLILGVIYFVVECLIMAQYFALVEATPDYWWHIFIILFGGLFTFVYPLWDQKR